MMSDDSETLGDTEKGSLAEVTDDSCTMELIPLRGASNDYHKLTFIDPIVEVKPEDLLDVKQEPADDSDSEDTNYSVKQESTDEYETDCPCLAVQVSSECRYSTTFNQYWHRLTVFVCTLQLGVCSFQNMTLVCSSLRF